MKSAKKIWLLVAGGLLVIGLIIGVIGGGIARLNPNPQRRYTQQTETFSVSGIDTIRTDVSNYSIEIIPTSKDTIDITYSNNEDKQISCRQVGSRIEVNYKSIFRISNFNFDLLNLEPDTFKIYIEVPSNFAGAFDIETSNSKVYAASFENLSDLKVKSSNGSIEIKDIKSDSASLKTSNASIELDNVKSNSMIDATSSNGHVDIKDCSAVKDITVKSTNGSIDVNETISHKLLAHTSNSKIVVENIKADIIDFSNTNGVIKGSIVGIQSEYNADIYAPNADATPSSYHDDDNTKSLYAHTSNASIDLRFIDRN